jgi:micrococcal nuclease
LSPGRVILAKMRTRILPAVLLAAASCVADVVDLSQQAPATLVAEPAGYEIATVTRIVDGDTIEVTVTGRQDGPGAGLAEVGRRYDVRLIGIDTPESVDPNSPVECFGREASRATAAFLEGRRVRLIDDVENSDQYDRLLRYVYVGEEMANARLVANGYAHAYTYPPNVRHSDLLVDLQRAARARGKGLWAPGACDAGG